jgi:outer membrane immunogenic protein
MLGSLRGRLGWSFDRALLYMTGGAAFRNSTNGDSISVYSAASNGTLLATYATNSDRSNVGWSLGGGLEWAFTNNVSLKVEYLHSQFDRGNNLFVTSTSSYNAYAFRNDNSTDSIDVVRFGINYRFGGPVAPAPVLARY